MSWFKKFWIVFVSFLPFGAGAVVPFVIGGIGAGVAVIGYSIYRSYVPVDMASAMKFFESCWSCQMFSDIMTSMGDLLPRAFKSLGMITIPVAGALTLIYFAWLIIKGLIGSGEDEAKDAWKLSGKFGTHVVKLAFIGVILLMPLPKMISNILVEPLFNVGFTVARAMDNNFTTGTADANSVATCLVTTAIMDPASRSAEAAARGAYSPRLRHNMTCSLAAIHQMTGIGMTVGWTMMNMAFSADYMHKILDGIPIFPNMILLIVGFFIVGLFFFALLPVPLYLLEVIIKLSMDMIMLPIYFLGWLFKGWDIFPKGTQDFKPLLDDLIKNALGIALVGVFVAFSAIFLNAVFSGFSGAGDLWTALQQNDSKFLMDSLMLRNDSLVTIILIGLFITMFMNAIPALVKALFDGVTIPDKYYEGAKERMAALRKNIQELWKSTTK